MKNLKHLKREIIRRRGVDKHKVRDFYWRVIEIHDHFAYKDTNAVFIRTTRLYINDILWFNKDGSVTNSKYDFQKVFWRWPYVNKHSEYYGTLKLCIRKYQILSRISSIIGAHYA